MSGRRATPDRDATISDLDEDEDERGPFRRCVATRERHEKARMIRFVLGPDRAIVPDLAGRLPGRGIWLSARPDVLEAARARTAFARAARGPVTVPPDLRAVVAAGLARRIGELLGLARRAGQAVGGFQKAREWLAGGRVGLLVQASDGSADERARLRSGGADVPVISPLPGAALGWVFGRDHLVHVALARGRLCNSIRCEAERLAGVTGRGTGGDSAQTLRQASAGETNGRPAAPVATE